MVEHLLLRAHQIALAQTRVLLQEMPALAFDGAMAAIRSSNEAQATWLVLLGVPQETAPVAGQEVAFHSSLVVLDAFSHVSSALCEVRLWVVAPFRVLLVSHCLSFALLPLL